jgi:hypothetical protein
MELVWLQDSTLGLHRSDYRRADTQTTWRKYVAHSFCTNLRKYAILETKSIGVR